MIKRELYLKQIRPFINKPLIKVLTGIRRSGKSAILSMLKDELIDSGVTPENIIYINFESMIYSDIENEKDLYKYVNTRIVKNNKMYIMLDEIQEVKNWEKAINSFLVDFDCDIYITGSNSRLLSSELSTYIAGRYVEINITPLSFAESLYFDEILTGMKPANVRNPFYTFVRKGGFPVLYINNYSEEAAYKIVSDIYSSAILRDIIGRHKIRNVALLEKIVKFIFDNIGNTFSAKKIIDYFKSEQRRVDIETIYNYLTYLKNAFIIHMVSRYDLKRKEILKTNEKFYLGDQALKYAVMGYKDRDISGVLENIVYLELKRRGYNVYVGKIADKEIDFVAERKSEKVYVQVAYRLSDDKTVAREFGNLMDIPDHYPKYVVTTEEFWQDNIEGIKHKHIADFLLMNEF